MNAASPRPRLASRITRSDGGAYFQTRRRVPKTSASSISNIDGSAVRSAWVSAMLGGLASSGAMPPMMAPAVDRALRLDASAVANHPEAALVVAENFVTGRRAGGRVAVQHDRAVGRVLDDVRLAHRVGHVLLRCVGRERAE